MQETVQEITQYDTIYYAIYYDYASHVRKSWVELQSICIVILKLSAT